MMTPNEIDKMQKEVECESLKEKVEKMSKELDTYSVKLNDNEMITISLEEYKELLIIKGKYEELKKQQPLIFYDGLNENGTTFLPCKDIKTTDPFSPPYKIN